MSPLCSQYFCALMVTQRLMTRYVPAACPFLWAHFTPAFMFTVCRTKICGYKGAVSFYCCRSLSFGMFCPLFKMRWWSTVIFQGNILYRFPSLQRTAVDWLGRRKATSSEGLPNVYFSESQWNFRYSVICLIPDR
jgi:hypothetical protein